MVLRKNQLVFGLQSLINHYVKRTFYNKELNKTLLES